METGRDLPLATKEAGTLEFGHRHDGEAADVIWVHLCSGKIIEVRPATDVQVEDDRLVVRAGETVTATFPRDQVYYTCRDGDACSVLS